MEVINNSIYNELGSRWYQADDDPVALLRAESRLRNPWICKKIEEHLVNSNQNRRGSVQNAIRVLDIGCGGGFLSNQLAQNKHEVTGIDLSEESLKVAVLYDATKTVKYLQADATQLPFLSESFDVVCSMDLLEHVDHPDQVVAEASRVLKPGGLFFFYTFNRTFLSWLLAIKSLEWFVKNTPKHLHVYSLFIKPKELSEMCRTSGLQIDFTSGIKPVICTKSTLNLLLTGKVSSDFRFEFTRWKACGYLFFGRKT